MCVCVCVCVTKTITRMFCVVIVNPTFPRLCAYLEQPPWPNTLIINCFLAMPQQNSDSNTAKGLTGRFS